MTNKVFFDGWESLIRTIVIGILAYIAVVILLRISGKRTLSKLNAFDFVITVALGSTLATVLLSKDVSLAQGILALALLISMQYVVTWVSVRHKPFRNFVKSEPTLIAYQGKLLHDAMRKQRIAEDEIQAAVRSANLHSLDDVDAVVLETDSSLNVIGKTSDQHRPSIIGIATPEG